MSGAGTVVLDLSLLRLILCLLAGIVLVGAAVGSYLYFRFKASLKYRFDRLDRSMAEFKRLNRQIPDILLLHGRREFRQVESLIWLRQVLALRRRLPWTRGWSASPDFLLYLNETIRDRKPHTIVELGSGVSTLVMADALHHVGSGRLVSLEHLEDYAGEITRLLARENLSDIVEIRHAPLKTMAGDSTGQNIWYDPDALVDVKQIDLLVVDGPPRNTCPRARYPALPVLKERLAKGCLILLDDASREDEQAVLDAWQREFGLEATIHREYDKGLAVLQWIG